MKKANVYKEEFFRAFWNPRWLIVILLSIIIFSSEIIGGQYR